MASNSSASRLSMPPSTENLMRRSSDPDIRFLADIPRHLFPGGR